MYIDLVTINLCPGQGGGGVKPSGTLDISENGVYDVYSYSSASVDVHPSTSLSETYISNGNYNITGEFNGGVIKVDVPAPQFVTETLNVSANGTYTPGQGVDGYSQVVVDVPQNVIGFTEKEITEGVQIVNLSNSASYVNSYAFANNRYLQTVNLPNCTSVGVNAFSNCSNLKTVSFPECKSIRSSVFNECKNLEIINIPLCSYIGDDAFNYCISLSQVSLPVCNYIGGFAFYNCSKLSQLTLCTETYKIPSYNNTFTNTSFNKGIGSIYVDVGLYDNFISSTGWSKFSSLFVSVGTIDPMLSFSDGLLYGKTKNIYSDWGSYTGVTSSLLIKVSLSECNILNSNTFSNCINLSEVYLPEVTYIGSNVFHSCPSLHQVGLPICSYIGSTAFYTYPAISLSLTLGYNGVCKLDGQLFDGNKKSLISIFVPASLVDAYKSATNWSYFSTQIFPIPE